MPLSSAIIAQSVGVNAVTIRKVIGKLQSVGLVETIAGSRGGAQLARHPSKITLKELFVLLEKNSVFGVYPENPDQSCLVGRNLQPVLNGIHQAAWQQMLAALGDVTIADVLADVKQESDR